MDFIVFIFIFGVFLFFKLIWGLFKLSYGLKRNLSYINKGKLIMCLKVKSYALLYVVFVTFCLLFLISVIFLLINQTISLLAVFILIFSLLILIILYYFREYFVVYYKNVFIYEKGVVIDNIFYPKEEVFMEEKDGEVILIIGNKRYFCKKV